MEALKLLSTLANILFIVSSQPCSQWFDIDQPSGNCDCELVGGPSQLIPTAQIQQLGCDTNFRVEGRRVGFNNIFSTAQQALTLYGQVIQIRINPNPNLLVDGSGFLCWNADNVNQCFDYAMRICCNPTTSPSSSPSLIPTQPPIVTCTTGGSFTQAMGYPDPHFRTWFGSYFDYHGPDCYKYATNCPGTNPLPFEIKAQHFPCGGAKCISEIYITINTLGTFALTQITIGTTQAVLGGTFTIDPWNVNTQYNYEERLVYLDTPNCNGLDFKLKVIKYNYNSSPSGFHLRIDMDPPTCYECNVCGLFGYLQSDQSKQFLKSNGQVTTNMIDFGDSWQDGTTCSRRRLVKNSNKRRLQLDPSPCDTDTVLKTNIENECEILKNNANCCTQFINDCEVFKQNCIDDACAVLSGDPTVPIIDAVKEFGVDNFRDNCDVLLNGLPDTPCESCLNQNLPCKHDIANICYDFIPNGLCTPGTSDCSNKGLCNRCIELNLPCSNPVSGTCWAFIGGQCPGGTILC